MDKRVVQKRVLKNGKPLSLSDFTWCEKTNTFSTTADNLVLDFCGIPYCAFKTGSGCAFKTGSGCAFKTGSGCAFKTGSGCTFDTSSGCTFKTSYDCTFKTGSGCTFKTSSGCTFKTGSGCTFKTGSGCTFDTSSGCTFKTSSDCTFDTGSGCTFKTSYDCTFKTSYDCTFDTGYGCTFDTGSGCVIVRRDTFEIIQPKADIIQLCPAGIAGHLVNGKLNGVPHIIADGILSKIISQKGDLYKVVNHGEDDASFIIKLGVVYSHGKTVKEARDSLIYKIGDRDTSKYEDLTLDSILTLSEAIQAYRVITGACEGGVKSFVEQNKEKSKDNFSIKELIVLTKGQFGGSCFKQFFN